jgi:hypothetical protein
MTVAARLVASTIAAQAVEEEEASDKPEASKRRWMNFTTLEVIQHLQTIKPNHSQKSQHFQQVMSPMALATDTTELKKGVTVTGPLHVMIYLVAWGPSSEEKTPPCHC